MTTLFFDPITLTTSIIILLLGIVTPMLSPFFRFKKRWITAAADTDATVALPPLSIILTPYDDTQKLRKTLPSVLGQHYAPGYQVVVVIDQGDHEAEAIIGELLEQTKSDTTNAEVYVTRIPRSSRYISRKKLAITLGIKAARHNWVLLTEASCRPATPQWLARMASHCGSGNNMVIGYGRYEDTTADFRRYERLRDSLYLMHEDAVGTPYRTNSYNILLRKSEFMEQNGYLGNLQLMRGEYDFLVNKYAHRGATALELSEEAWLIEDEPTNKTWLNKHVFYMETRKLLQRSMAHRWLFNTDQTALHLSLVAAVAGGAVAAVAGNLTLLLACALSLITNIVFRIILIQNVLKIFAEDISILKVIFYEVSMAYCNLGYMLRYRRADKNDFTTHKL